jgi:aldehyde:ferredoxin oxidoreductase
MGKADDLAGLGVYATAPKLLEKYGDKVAIALIGPGGEMRMKSAGIQNIDKDRIPSRIAARGGLGAVMATKGLKAIVFDHAGGQKPAIADPEAFKVAQKDYTKAVMEHPQSVTYRDYGTAAMAQMTQSFAPFPRIIFLAVPLTMWMRSAVRRCASSRSLVASRLTQLMPVWQAVPSNARISSVGKMARSSSRRWNMKLLA